MRVRPRARTTAGSTSREASSAEVIVATETRPSDRSGPYADHMSVPKPTIVVPPASSRAGPTSDSVSEIPA